VATTAYGGVLAVALVRAGSHVAAFVPGAAVGTLLLLVALAFGGSGLGAALFVGAATYVGAIVAAGHRTDATAPVVAVLLLLCGELTAWSADERWEIRSDPRLAWRRGAAFGVLVSAGLAVATLVVSLSAVPPGHGLAWTVIGAAAAVGAAGTGIWVARRTSASGHG
jgi:hypothetical protein